VYQTIELSLEYLQYKTSVEVVMMDYVSDVTINILPAISFCRSTRFIKSTTNENTIKIDFDKIENFKEHFIKCKSLACHMDSTYYHDLLNNQSIISDYLKLVDIESDYLKCSASKTSDYDGIDSIDAEKTFNMVTSHYGHNKCYTYFSRLVNGFNQSIKIKEPVYFQAINVNGYLYIHDSNQLPSFPTSKLSSIPVIEGNYEIKYDKIHFERMPSPYETNCQYYSGKIKSQAQCINEFIYDSFIKYQCLPKTIYDIIGYMIIDFKYTKFKYKSCDKNKQYLNITNSIGNCRQACVEEIYEVYQSVTPHLKLYLKAISSQYISLKYSANMSFMQYIISFGGLLGLWQGISLNDLKNIITHRLESIRHSRLFSRIFVKYFTFSRSVSSILSHFKIKVSFRIIRKHLKIDMRNQE
jgi:hypothetical protein